MEIDTSAKVAAADDTVASTNSVDDDLNSYLEEVLSDCDAPSETAAQSGAAEAEPGDGDPERDETLGKEGKQKRGRGEKPVKDTGLTSDVSFSTTEENHSFDEDEGGDLHPEENSWRPTLHRSTSPDDTRERGTDSFSSMSGGYGGLTSSSGSTIGAQNPKLSLLLPFVPRLVLQMYDADAPQMPTGPMHMLFDAAVGLFDVSGFSKIADRLEKEEAIGGLTSAVESEGVALRRKGSMMPEQSRGLVRAGSNILQFQRHNSVAAGLNDPGRDGRPNRLRALMGVSMALGGRMGESRPNLKKGSAAERLTDYLNYILGLLTGTVERHGGDILKFAGDAIIVCWSPSRELGIELVNSVDPVMSSLGLHIGLGASKVLAGHVGGIENRWEFFITGEACEEMNQAEKEANNMEIVFSRSVGDGIRRFKGRNGGTAELATVKLESGYERLMFLDCPPENLPDVLPHAILKNDRMCDLLKMYIPQPVKIKLKDGVVETAGGIRKITVVFMELLDLEIAVSDAKDTLDQVNRTVRKIQEAVCHYEATLRQFIVDDKGTVAIVVFGLPPIFHEDNAARGINLALRLLRQGVQAKIGVTTGSAFAGVIGAASRLEYAAVGDAVNMSARLMGKAERNTVLCDASTVKEAEDAFSFKEAMRIKVKGKEEAIAVFEPLEGRDKVLRTKAASHFFDRGDHANRLQDVVSNAYVPVGTKTVFIEGERGSGKSILLSKAVGMMDGQELLTFCSSGDIHEKHTSLFPFRQILCQVLELEQDRLGWYGANNRTTTPTAYPPPASAAAGVDVAGGAPTAAALANSSGTVAKVDTATAPTSATSGIEAGAEVTSRLQQRSSKRRSSAVVAVGLGFLARGDAGEHDTAEGAPGGTDSPPPSLQAPTGGTHDQKRSSWGGNMPGRNKRGSTDTLTALQPYEPAPPRGHLVNNPSFAALMKDPELSKHLPLLNMILPLYNEQAVGAITSGALDTHSKLRRLADMIAALLAHRLDVSKKGLTRLKRTSKQSVAVTATPGGPPKGRRGTLVRAGSAIVLAVIGDTAKTPATTVDEGKGCGAAIVLDNAQWLDHNSWELMYLLRKALPGMLIFAAFRPFSEMNLKNTIALKTVPGTLKMNMGRLTSTQVALILANSFGVQRTNEELLEFLEVTAKGNPRDVIHMMEDLFKEGIVEVNLGAAVILKELSENSLKIKDHTSAPVIAKYDQLTRGTQLLVQAAAVIGREVPLDLLFSVHSFVAQTSEKKTSPPSSKEEEEREEQRQEQREMGLSSPVNPRMGGDVDEQIDTLVRAGLLERSSSDSVRFVAKYMVTVIYDMILHSQRQDMHKQIILWYLTRKSLAELRPHFRFLGQHAMAAADQDLAVEFLVMAAEVAISCGDPAEAQLACAAVTQAVDDSGASGHHTILDQVLRETKFHLLVGQTAILSQDWESAEMSLQLAIDLSGVDNKPKRNLAEKIRFPWKEKRRKGYQLGRTRGYKSQQHTRWFASRGCTTTTTQRPAQKKRQLPESSRLTLRQRAEQAELSRRGSETKSERSNGSNISNPIGEEGLDLGRLELYGPCGVMLKKCGNDAKELLYQLKKYQEATRSFHLDLLADNMKVIQAHTQMFVASAGLLSVSHRTDPAVLPVYLRGNGHNNNNNNNNNNASANQKKSPASAMPLSPLRITTRSRLPLKPGGGAAG